MNIQADSPLREKINQLELYIQEKYPKKNLKINGFIEDLKAIEPNLTILGLLNHLCAMYKEGSSIDEIVDDVKKTKKVFTLAGEYVKALEEDKIIAELSEEIHTIILIHLEKALQLYKDEYDVDI